MRYIAIALIDKLSRQPQINEFGVAFSGVTCDFTWFRQASNRQRRFYEPILFVGDELDDARGGLRPGYSQSDRH
jgi:hypothetical protein